METFTVGLGDRWWSRVGSRNPLVRSSDRIEAMVLSLAVLLTLVAVPIAGAIDTFVYDAGRGHSDIVMWSDQVKAGDRQPIWVDADGAQVGPPSSSSDAAADAVGIAINVWLGLAAASAGLVYVVRRGLDRRRYAQWDSEINASRENHGRTNHQ